MKKTISRTIPVTHIQIAKLEEVDGSLQIVEDVVSIAGNLSKEEAEKALIKQHGTGVTVKGIEVEVSLFELSVEKFIELADKKEASDELAE